MTLDYRKNTPVDHVRTTRQHAGESIKNGANAPGLAGAAAAVVAVTVGLFAVAAGHPVGGAIALIVAAALGALSAAWLLRTHRKVRDAEVRWHASHSDQPAPPPSS
jgi:protein-S-isoprenylcysteine O-methyltransferase Ste14